MDTFSSEYILRYAEGNRDGLLKLRAFFDLCQDMAGRHAEILGVGMDTQLARHRAWMLSRVKVRVTRYPRFGESVKITTWPAGCDRLLARREIRVHDANGVELAAMTMLWMICDTVAMSVIPATREVGEIPDNPQLPHAFDSIGKLPAPEAPEVATFRIRESQLDINNHLNNAEYAALIQDCLGAGRYPAELQINYQKAIPPEGEVRICGGVEGNTFAYAGYCNGNVAFTAAGTLLDNSPRDNG